MQINHFYFIILIVLLLPLLLLLLIKWFVLLCHPLGLLVYMNLHAYSNSEHSRNDILFIQTLKSNITNICLFSNKMQFYIEIIFLLNCQVLEKQNLVEYGLLP